MSWCWWLLIAFAIIVEGNFAVGWWYARYRPEHWVAELYRACIHSDFSTMVEASRDRDRS